MLLVAICIAMILKRIFSVALMCRFSKPLQNLCNTAKQQYFICPPPPQGNSEPLSATLNALAHLPIQPITHLSQASESLAMVTDVSNRLWEYAMTYKKPVILCLLGFVSTTGDDRLSQLLKIFTSPVFSLAELSEKILSLPEIASSTQTKIEDFLARTMV